VTAEIRKFWNAFELEFGGRYGKGAGRSAGTRARVEHEFSFTAVADIGAFNESEHVLCINWAAPVLMLSA